MANEFKIKKGLIVTGASGGTVVDIQGSQGQLFSVTDNLSGEIFAVADISGVPIFNVNSSGLSTFTGDLTVDGASITIDTDTAGTSLVWKESDSSTTAGQLRGYGNRGDIYLYDSGVKRTELSSQADSFIPALHIGGTAAATGGVLQTTGNVNIDGSADISATVTATTFSGDLNGTINTATTAVTQANAVDDETVATTAYVNNKIGLIPAGLVFQGTWNAATNTPTLTSGSGTTGNFYIVSTPGNTNLDGITDWKTGDWAVFIEQGASDQWEKIDNSSVLDGFGTGGSVAGWSGSGTSNTLTNAPITFSGSNVTIPGTGQLILPDGSVSAPSICNTGDTNTGIYWPSDHQLGFTVNGSRKLYMSSTGAFFQNLSSGVNINAGGINVTGNSTFAGAVDINGIGTWNTPSGGVAFNVDAFTDGFGVIRFRTNGNASKWDVGINNSNHFYIGNNGVNTALEIEEVSSNATFAGIVETNKIFVAKGQNLAHTPSSIKISQESTAKSQIRFYGANTSTAGILEFVGSTSNGSAGGARLTINADGSSTFAGYVETTKVRSDIMNNKADTANIIYRSGTDTIIGNNANALVVEDGGNVGVGTTSPDNRLDVVASDVNITPNAESSAVFRRNGNNYLTILSNASNEGGILFGNAVDDNDGSVSYRHNTQSMQFATADVERMRINSSGNVGIGTTNPTAAKLVVDSSTAPQILVKNSSGNNAQILFEDNSGGTQNASIKFDQASQNTLTIETGYNSPNNTNRIYLAPAGDVALTAMGGSGGASATKVGIGTTTPVAKFEVTDGSSSITLQEYTNGAAIFFDGVNGDFIGGDYYHILANGSSYLGLGGYGGGSTPLNINSVGKIGIGTTSPTYKLSVSGGIEAGGLVTYSKVAGTVSTTGYAVAGLVAGFNGASAGFEFKCYGGNSKYQRIVYSCHCSGTTWAPGKVIDEGTNDLDVVASANGATITFTFKARSSTQSFSPRVVVQATGHSINSTYA